MKKRYFLFIYSLALFSCKKQGTVKESRKEVTLNTTKQSHLVDTGLVVLGKKLENPYALVQIKNTIKKLGTRSARATRIQDMKPTHLYVRFLPKNAEEISWLYNDTNLIYSSIPVGYEIIKEGSYYQDPSIPKGQITWLYATVAPNYKFPNIQYEVLEELYKPTAFESEIEIASLALTNNIGNDTLSTQARNASQLQRSMPNIVSFFGGRKYNPSGNIYVTQHVDGNNSGKVPLRRAKIYVQYWFWNNTAYTDDNGRYFVNEKYTKEVGVYLENRGHLATISGAWNEYAGIKISDKLGNGKGGYQRTIEKDEDHIWPKATVQNGIALYADFADANQIKQPNNVRTWIGLVETGSGVAAMLHDKSFTVYTFQFPTNKLKNNSPNASSFDYINNDYLYLAAFGLGATLDAISLPAKHLLPDIVLGRQSDTYHYYATVFHELCHYSHYHNTSQAWWASVMYETLINGSKAPYGDGTKDWSGNRLTLAESWAEGLDKLYSERKFKNEIQEETIETFSIPYASFVNENYLPFELIIDLIDENSNNIELKDHNRNIIKSGIDQVSGIMPSDIYPLLSNSTNSLEELKLKLIAQFPEKNKNSEITNLFSYYGY